MVHEFSNTYKGVFFTLTYDEDKVPFVDLPAESFDEFKGMTYKVQTKNGGCYTRVYDGKTRTVKKSDVQNWLKRFREKCRRSGRSTDWKYWVTSEYGPSSFRPHYHGLFFGLCENDVIDMMREWSELYGDAQYSDIRIGKDKSPEAVCSYVSKYCSKGVFECPLCSPTYVDKLTGEVIERGWVASPTFHLISKGIGKSYVEKNIAFHLNLSALHYASSPCVSDFDISLSMSLFGLSSLPRDYVQSVVSRNRIRDNNGFIHSMPRYYFKLLYVPANDKTLARYKKHNSILYDYEIKKRNRLTLLPNAIKAILSEKSEQVYFDKLAEVSTNFPFWSDSKKVFYTCQALHNERISREDARKSSLKEFYSCSYI